MATSLREQDESSVLMDSICPPHSNAQQRIEATSVLALRTDVTSHTAVELRIDITDGNPYPRESFLEYYGPQDGESRWLDAPLLVSSAPGDCIPSSSAAPGLDPIIPTTSTNPIALVASTSPTSPVPAGFRGRARLEVDVRSTTLQRPTPQHAGIICAMEDALINADYVQIGDEDAGHPHLAYMGRKGNVVAFTIKHNVWIELRERVGAQRRRRHVTMAPFTDKALQRLMHDLGFKAARTTPSDPECDRFFAFDRAKYMRHGGRSLPGGKGLAPAERGN